LAIAAGVLLFLALIALVVALRRSRAVVLPQRGGWGDNERRKKTGAGVRFVCPTPGGMPICIYGLAGVGSTTETGHQGKKIGGVSLPRSISKKNEEVRKDRGKL